MELASKEQTSTVEEWQSVDRNYIKVLRAGFSIVHAIGLLAAIIFIWLLPALPQSVGDNTAWRRVSPISICYFLLTNIQHSLNL